MKKVGLVIGGIIAFALVVMLVLLLVVDVNEYRGVIETRLAGHLGREVTLGAMRLGFLPLRFEADDTVIAEDPAFGDRSPFVRADRLDVRVSLFPLLRGEIEVKSLELERPLVELVRNNDGAWNFSTLGAGATGRSEVALAASQTPTTGRTITLARLTVRDGQVGVTRLGPTEVRSVYDHIDLELRDYTAGQPFSFDAAAHIQGEGTQELRITGEAGPLSRENPLDTPFRGSLGLDEVGVEGLKAFLQTEGLADSRGSLTGESELENRSGTLHATGNLDLVDARFNGIEFGYPIAVTYNAEADLAQRLFTILSATVRLGETPFSLAGSVNAATTPTSLDLDIESREVDVQEIARLASSLGLAFPSEATVDGRVSLDVHVGGSTARPALDGTIAGRDLQIFGAGIEQPVEVGVLDIALSPDEIRSNEFEITSGDTTATGRFALLDYATENRQIDARLHAPGATLPEIQSIARAYGVRGLDQIEGEGLLDVDLRASGPVESIGPEGVARLLDGDIDLDFSPLEVSGFNTISELGTIVGFTGGSEGQDLTDILRLTGQIAIRNGIAETDDLRAELTVGNITAAGTADLAAQTLDLRGLAVLSQEFSQTVGGTRVGGYLSTALSNDAGEIVIPVILSGDLRRPRFAPDVDTFARMQAERLLPGLDDPVSAVTDLLGALAGGSDTSEAVEGQEEPEASPTDALRDILGGLLGGRSEEPQ